jgi:hypothetical protein
MKKKNNLSLIFILIACVILLIVSFRSETEESIPELDIEGKSYVTRGLLIAKDVAFFGIMKTILIFFGVFYSLTKKKE